MPRPPAPVTPDGRYLVVRGRLWRRTRPDLADEERQTLVDALMDARRGVRDALRRDDADALGRARASVDAAKRGLGERGPVWWSDGAPDYNRRMAANTPYAAWWKDLENDTMPNARGFRTHKLEYDDVVLERIDLPKEPLTLTLGLGSGLARRAGDDPGRFYAVGDRGPNLKVKLAVKRYGVERLDALRKVDGAKIMPALAHGPAISELAIEGDAVRIVRTFPLRGEDGVPLSGLPVPGSLEAEGEPIFSLAGDPLGTDPSGLDSEGLIALADGGFWVGDEYGPSLLRLDADGRVLVRWVPRGTAALYEGARYPVADVLPELASARRLNRGFEAIATSADESALFLAFQSPLAHPDRAAHERSRHVRIWHLDAATGALRAEYVYPLDPPEAFLRDVALGDFEQSDVKVSEIVALGPDRLLVLERGSATTKIYRADLAHPAPASLVDRATRPTLEQMDADELAAAGVVPLAKTLVLDTDLAPEIPGDLEGAIRLGPRELLLVNDNDFGTEGVDTQFWRVLFDENRL